eukprot:2165695-Rhodomonas_salina.2
MPRSDAASGHAVSQSACSHDAAFRQRGAGFLVPSFRSSDAVLFGADVGAWGARLLNTVLTELLPDKYYTDGMEGCLMDQQAASP